MKVERRWGFLDDLHFDCEALAYDFGTWSGLFAYGDGVPEDLLGRLVMMMMMMMMDVGEQDLIWERCDPTIRVDDDRRDIRFRYRALNHGYRWKRWSRLPNDGFV